MRLVDLLQLFVEVFMMYMFVGVNQGYCFGDCKVVSLLGFICGIVWFNGIIILDIYVLVVEVIVSVRFVGKSLKKFYLVENLYVVLYLF